MRTGEAGDHGPDRTLGPRLPGRHLSGNPLAMAAGLATLRAAGQPGFYDRLEELGSRWREGMGEAASAGNHPSP